MSKHKKTFKYSILLIIILINIYSICEVPTSNAKYYKDNSESSVISLETYKYNYKHDLIYDTNDIKTIYYQNHITYEFNIDRNTAIYSEYDEDRYTFSVDNNNCSINNNEIVYTNNNPDIMTVTVSCNIQNTNETFKLNVTEKTGNNNIDIDFLSSENIEIKLKEYSETEKINIINDALDVLKENFPYYQNLTDQQKSQILKYLKAILNLENTDSLPSNILKGATYQITDNGTISITYDDTFINRALTYENDQNLVTEANDYRLFLSASNTENINLLYEYLSYYNYSESQIQAIINSINNIGINKIFEKTTTDAVRMIQIQNTSYYIQTIKTNDNILKIIIQSPSNINIPTNNLLGAPRRSVVIENDYTLDEDTNLNTEITNQIISKEEVQELIKNGNENNLPDFVDYTTIIDDKKLILVVIYNISENDEIKTYVKLLDLAALEEDDTVYLPINPTTNEFENYIKIINEEDNVTYELLPVIDGTTGEYIYEENDNNIKCYKYSISKISE